MNFIINKYGFNLAKYPDTLARLIELHKIFCFLKSKGKSPKILLNFHVKNRSICEWFNIEVKSNNFTICGIIVNDLNIANENFDFLSTKTQGKSSETNEIAKIEFDNLLLKEFNFILRTNFKGGIIYYEGDEFARYIVNNDLYLE